MTRIPLRVHRPWRRFFCCVVVVLLTAAAGYPVPPAAPAKTTVSDVLYRADGTPAAGTLVISWPAFTTADQAPVAAGSLSVPIGPGGVVSLALVPNEGAEPAGTYYKVVLKLAGGETSTEYWTVPATSPASISAIRATVMPAGVAIQAASRAYVDTAVAGKASDAAVLHNSGDESVAGVKQFSASPLVPTPTADQGAANKAYVDGATAVIGNLFVAKAGDSMAGPLTLSGDPAAPGQAANRHYVDTQIAVVSGGLAGKADVVHTQDASTITSGTLDAGRLPAVPVSKGGTGQSSWTSSRCVRVKNDGSGLEAAPADCGVAETDWANPGEIGQAAPNNATFTAASVQSLNHTRYASRFNGADAGVRLQAAINDLPATGGTVEADFEGAHTISSDVFAGISKPVHLMLGAGAYSFSSNVTIPANVTLEFRQGAKLAPAAGQTVTVLGSVRAAAQQPIIDPANGSVLLKGNDLIYITWYGARNDALIVQSCSMTSGSAVLSGCSVITGSGFTAADVGKTILFHDYGYSGYPGIASAKIQSYTSASQVTLDTNAARTASGIIAYYGTDALAATNAALANGSKRYLYFRSQQLAVAGGNASVHADYVFSGAVVINTAPACANGIWIDGDTSTGGYSGGAATLVFPSTSGGFKVGPDCYTFKMSNLELFGLGGWYDGNLSTYTLFNTNIQADGPHGIVLAGGEPQLENVYVRQFKGHGIYVDGTSTVFPNPPAAHPSQPDFWKFYNVGVDGNRGYGIYTAGADSNSGVAMMVNSRANQLGGIYDYSQLGDTWVQVGSHYDNRASIARGSTKALTSCSVTSNVMDCVTSVTHSFTMQQWVVTAGQVDSSFNGTCQISNIVSTTEFQCPFPHADGSTSGGTAQTAAAGDVYTVYAAVGTPSLIAGSLVGRGASSSSTWLHPYCETSAEAPPYFNQASLVLGGNCVGNTGTGASINYGGIQVSNGAMFLYGQGFTLRQANGGTLNLNLVSGQNSDPLAPGYQQNNIRNINFYKWDNSTIQYQLQTTAAGNVFWLANLVNASGLYDQGSGNWELNSAGSNPVSFNKARGTGGVCFGDGAGHCYASTNAAGKGTFVGLTATMETITFSGTPTFDCSKGNAHKITLTADVTSSTLSNCSAGQTVEMIVCQDSGGSHAFAWPSTMKGGMTVGATASKCSAQSFIFDGTNAYATSSGVINQ